MEMWVLFMKLELEFWDIPDHIMLFFKTEPKYHCFSIEVRFHPNKMTTGQTFSFFIEIKSQVVSRQKTGIWLADLSGLPVRGLFSEKNDFN